MPKTHVTVSGDTFDMLALEYFNNEKMASAIIQENPEHCDTIIFEAGVPLTIPDAVTVALPETLPPWRRNA